MKASNREFSRRVPAEKVRGGTHREAIEALPEEREAVARRLGLESLGSLKAEATFRQKPGEAVIEVEGHFAADVTQICVVKLEPFEESLEESFLLHYTAAPDRSAHNEDYFDPDAPDPAEPLEFGGIDLGEAVVQQLSLALDPYPRSEGAVLEDQQNPEANDEVAEDHPFAVLRDLKT